MQLVSSRIWTRVALSISYDDNHYTTGTFIDSPNNEPDSLNWVRMIEICSYSTFWEGMNALFIDCGRLHAYDVGIKSKKTSVEFKIPR